MQAVLDAHNVGGQKQRVHNQYLKGSVRYAECGSTLCITRAVNRHGSEYLYFFCLGNYRRYTACQERAVVVELVESYIEAALSVVTKQCRTAVGLERVVPRAL